jgi:hypothetical protein
VNVLTWNTDGAVVCPHHQLPLDIDWPDSAPAIECPDPDCVLEFDAPAVDPTTAVEPAQVRVTRILDGETA